MIKNLLLLLFLVVATNTAFGYKMIDTQVTIGANTAPDDAAALEINSTTGGFLLPRMSSVQRDLLSAPVPDGMMIYNSTASAMQIYSAGVWAAAGGGGGVADWATATEYLVGDVVIVNDGFYQCLTIHTSGVFATDFGSGYWNEINTFEEINYNTASTTTTCAEGRTYWNSVDKTLNICTDQTGVSIQVGQEGHKRVYNNTGSTITNGQVVYINGHDGGSGFSTVALARSDLGPTSTVTLGIATHDITNTSVGLITVWGLVRDIDTSSYSAGDVLYLSPTVAGGLTNVTPGSPNFVVRVGVVGEVNAATGTIDVEISIGNNKQDVVSVFNGAILEHHTVTVATEAEATGDCAAAGEADPCVKATLDTTGSTLSLFLDNKFSIFAVPAKVVLSAGADTAPTLNYVYIPNSTKTLTASTSGWPAEQHVPVGTFLIQSIASVTADAPYKEHAWTDHMTGGNDQGHISHLNRWIRSQNATYLSGVAPTFAGSGTNSLTFATTAGVVLQLHDHTFSAQASPAEVRVINDSITPYISRTDLSLITLDSTGNSLQGRTFALVIWGSVNETLGSSKLYLNLPSGSYNSPDAVRADASKFTDYSIPEEFKGTGFLIHRLVVTINSPGTIWTIDAGAGDDIRGQLPNTSAGSSTAAATEAPDNLFRIFNVADDTKEMAFDVSTVSTATTRTYIAPNLDGTLLLSESAFAIAGTVSDPSFSFVTDLDTGLYLSWTDEISVTTGGLNALTVTDDQSLTVSGRIVSPQHIEYIINGGAENPHTNGWVTYKNTVAGPIPETGTGGIATWGWLRASGSSLFGDGYFVVNKTTAIEEGEGVGYEFDIDMGMQGKMLTGTFHTYLNDPDYEDGELRVYIYDITNSKLIEPVGRDIMAMNKWGSHKFQFQASPDSMEYRLIIHQATADTAAYTMYFDNFSISDSPKVEGVNVTEWTSFTPAWTGATTDPAIGNGTLTGLYRRVGDTMDIKIKMSAGTTTTFGTGGWRFGLPSGNAIDTNKSAHIIWGNLNGTGTIWDAGASFYNISAEYQDTTSIRVSYHVAGTSTPYLISTGTEVTNVLPITWTTGDEMNLDFSVPIVGWSANTIQSDDATQRDVSGLAGASLYQTLNLGDNQIDINGTTVDKAGSLDLINNRYTAPASGMYQVTATIALNNAAGSGWGWLYLYKDGAHEQTLGFISYTTGAQYADTYTALVELKKGEYIDIWFNAANNVADMQMMALGVSKVGDPSTISASSQVFVEYESTAGNSLGSAAQVVDFETKIEDSHNAVSGTGTGTGGTWRFTAPRIGNYRISAKYLFASTAYTPVQSTFMVINKNGTPSRRLCDSTADTTSAIYLGAGGTTTMRLNKGDYISLGASNSAGSTALFTAGGQVWVTITSEGL